MSAPASLARPIRCGVFTTLAGAERAVEALLKAGFDRDHISVVCTEEAHRRHFREFLHQDPGGRHTAAAALTGGTIGAALAGTAVVLASAAVTGGAALLAAGGAAIWTGGIFGGLVGAMMTRGVDRELAEYYAQAVEAGNLLVAVDLEKVDGHEKELNRAERILAEAGAEPVALPEG